MLALQELSLPIQLDQDGVARIGETRVTLETVLGWYLEGESPETIQRKYPVLHLEDIYATITYYLQNRAEVEAYLTEANRQSEAIRATIQQAGLRDRLLAR